MNGRTKAIILAAVVVIVLAFTTEHWVPATTLGVALAVYGVWLFLNPNRATPGGGARGSGGGRPPIEPTDVDR